MDKLPVLLLFLIAFARLVSGRLLVRPTANATRSPAADRRTSPAASRGQGMAPAGVVAG